MAITLQYFDDCPNWEITDGHLRTLVGEHAVGTTVHYTPEAAIEHAFRGSPTVLIDGADPFADPDDPVRLSCRVYITEDGPAGSPRPAGSPSLHQLQDAIAGRDGLTPW